MTNQYILDGHNPVAEPDPMKWAAWNKTADRIVRNCVGIIKIGGNPLGNVRISTVFLGLDHAFGDGPPMLFETMVFGGVLDGEQDLCSTWKAAEKMHAMMCERVARATEAIGTR